MKNITFFFFAFFFLAFFNAANSQSGGQSPVSGLGYAPDSNYIIISKLYRGRNGVAVWMHKDSIDWVGIKYDSVLFVSNNGLTGTPGSITEPFTGIQEAIEYAYNNNMTSAKIFVLDGADYDLGNIYIDSIPIRIETQGGISNFRAAGLNSLIIQARKISNFNAIGNSSIHFQADTIQTNSNSRTVETGAGEIVINCNTFLASGIIKGSGTNGTYEKTSLTINCVNYVANQQPWFFAAFGSCKLSSIVFKCEKYIWNHSSPIIGEYYASLDSIRVYIEIGELIAPVSRTQGILYFAPTAGGGSGGTTGMILDVHIGQAIGNFRILDYLENNGASAGNGKISITIDNFISTLTSGTWFANSVGALYDTLTLSGNYYSTVPMFNSTTWNFNVRIKNANIFCNQSSPVIRSTSGSGRKLEIENSIISNNGSSAIIDFASAKIIKVNDAYTYGPLISDPQVTFTRLNEMGLSTITANIYNTDGALTANRTVTGSSFNLGFTGMGNFTATGSGSATYRFNLYPLSSLPVLLEQTSAGDTAYLQLRASLGRATLRAAQDIYLEAENSVFVSTLEGSSTGIVSTRPTGELIRRERAFVNASINTDTFTVALSPTEINLPFNDDVSEGFNVSGDSLIYTGTDTAYFEIGYYQDIEFLESATGTYRLNLSVYQNGVNIPRSEMEHLIYYQNTTTEPILTAGKTFIVQLINGDVLNIRQNGTTGINAAIHNLSITANKIE